MNLDQNELEQVFEGLAVSGVRTMLWDSDDVLVYVDPGMQDLYKSKEFQKSFGKVDLTAGMSWLDWTKKENDLGIIEIPNDMNEQSYLKKLKKERIEIDLSELNLISKILSSISEGMSRVFKINHVKIKQDKLISPQH